MEHKQNMNQRTIIWKTKRCNGSFHQMSLEHLKCIHPSTVYTCFYVQSHGEAGAYLQRLLGEMWGTPWTVHQIITGTHKHSHTSKGNLQTPVNLTVMFLDCWSKPEYPERTHRCMGRTCKLLAEKTQVRTRTEVLLATSCITVQPAFTVELFKLNLYLYTTQYLYCFLIAITET
ncbi:hypothetical protein AMECASPLE_024677 [Ameca splendens]|uniref:Uncharacterized protein n=1 Tax=Ameca splendens TaxID=208324 RepID=A0ABV1ABL4_9TELE